jgi:general stress protein 26
MDLTGFVAETRRLGPLAHLATVAADGSPHVAPVSTDWHEGFLYVMVGLNGVKTRNLRRDPRLCLHYQVGEETGWDSLMVWGAARILESAADRNRLWHGVLSYDLDEFAPGGPDNSPDVGFLQIMVDRAVLLRRFGIDGREEWTAGTGHPTEP